ncbi:MAG: hypothetical protein IJT08_03535, partial [Alphaproteobacteria bacterium]|nr:hypothetical protein [Alphaproteobacteria bacterium]
ASHTVFSHVGDYIWAKDINDYADESFQNSIHLKYLHDNKLEDVLELLDMSLQNMDVENGQYRALEQPLPDMCADRIQYNIHTGVILGKLSKTEANDIASDLHFEEGRWFFTDPQIAKKFAEISLYCTQNFWGARWNTSMNIHFSNALKRAVDLKLLTMKDIFTTDAEVLKKVTESDDEVIKLNLQQCEQPVSRIPGKSYKTEFFKPKFRGVNPLVKDKSGKLRRLTELDPMFRNYYESVKKWCDEGFEIDILQL